MGTVIINCRLVESFRVIGSKNVIDKKILRFYLAHKKGEEILYCLPRLWRKKYYDEDLYGDCYGYGENYTRDEVLSWIKENYDFENHHLYEDGGEVYQMPYVRIEMNNGRIYDIFFRTVDECTQYCKDIVENDKKWLFVEI